MNTFAGFLLIDPRCVREHRRRFDRDAIPELDRANSYYSLAGRWPDVGWLLLDRASLDQIPPYANNLQLVIGDFVNAPLTIGNISIVQSRCVTRGLAADPNAVYLVQVTNCEGVLYNPWFQYPLNAQYNVRAPGYDGKFYSGSLTGANSTDAWTWDGMVGDIWGRAGGLLGAYPHLPLAPDGCPEGWVFAGVPLWEALSRVLEYLGLSVSGTYPSPTIVVPGAPDLAYSALVEGYAAYLEDSMEYLDQGSGRVPGQVVVYFHRRNQAYGTEETVTWGDDGLAKQWQNGVLYAVTAPAPAQFAGAAGTGYLWADYTVRADQDGNPLAADVAAANAIAAQRVQQYFDTIRRGTQGFARHTYAGVLPFQTGSLVDGVRWFNTGMVGGREEWCGWRTEVIRGYIWEEATFPTTLRGITGPY